MIGASLDAVWANRGLGKFVFGFCIPSMSQTMQYVYFFVFYTAYNAVFYTANSIAYASLAAKITKNGQERVQLGSIR